MTYTTALVSEIHEGMTVWDKTGNKVGTVLLAFPGEGDHLDEAATTEEVRHAVASGRLHGVVQQRLLSYGFIKLRTGSLFPGTRFVLPEQVAEVDSDEQKVYLSVDGDELVKG